MTGLAAIGGTILGAGTAVTFASVAVGAIASAVVGAVVGGLVSAVAGGDIGQGMLFGAIGGVALGAAFGTGIAGAFGAGGEVATGATGEALVSGVTTEAGQTFITGATYGTGEGVVGGVAEGVLGAGITEGEMLLASTVAGGVKEMYGAQQAGEAQAIAQEEADKQRAFLASESTKSLTAAMERAELAAAGTPGFYLAEKQALSKTETDEAIRRYEAQVATDVGARGAEAEATAGGILEVAKPTRGRFIDAGVGGIQRIGATA